MLKKTAFFVVIFVLLCACQVRALITEAQLREFSKKCGGNAEDVDMAAKYLVPSTPTGKCLMSCIMKEAKGFNENGVLEENTLLSSFKTHWSEIPIENLKQVAHDCAKTLESYASQVGSCEYGYQAILCVNSRFKQVQDILPRELLYSPYIDYGTLNKFAKIIKSNGSTPKFRGYSIINMKEYMEINLSSKDVDGGL